MHHPWDYFVEVDGGAGREKVHRCCDLLLRGHLHKTESERVSRHDADTGCLELAAGCVYQDSPYPNAFQWVELYPNQHKVRVHYRIWQHGKWMADRNQNDGPEDWIDYIFRRQPAVKLDSGSQPAPAGATGSSAKDRSAPRSIRPTAIEKIALILSLSDVLNTAIASNSTLDDASTPEVLAGWLCDQNNDFFAVMLAFTDAVTQAGSTLRGAKLDTDALARHCRDVLGWLVVTTVLEGYDSEDGDFAKQWFDGCALNIPLGRSPCVEVLSACWQRGRAEFSTEPARYDYGRHDLTPMGMQELGFDDPNAPYDPQPVLQYVLGIVYKETYGEVPPVPIDPPKIKDMKAKLASRQRRSKRRKRLVIDRAKLDAAFELAAVADAIGEVLPEIDLIFIDSGNNSDPSIFSIPASDLAAEILEALQTIEKLQ